MTGSVIIGDYLIQRLEELGVRHVFGVPGDYVLGFFKKLEQSGLQVINTCDEQGAGFAADAYARLTGLGVVCITYGVGGLKVANTTAEAYAERAPVLVISGAPGAGEKLLNPMLHHKVGHYDTQKRVFENLVAVTADLSDRYTALREIDRVLEVVLREKRPGYIELPRDMVSLRGTRLENTPLEEEVTDPAALYEALDEALGMIDSADQPVILAGAEMQRFGLEDLVIEFAEKTNIPMAVSILGKSAIPESHPLYLGVYAGILGAEAVREYVETSDCLILTGVLLTDINLGVNTARLEPSRSIHVTNDRISVKHHHYQQVAAGDFLRGLIEIEARWHEGEARPPQPQHVPFEVAKGDPPISVRRLFECLNSFLDCNTVVVADVGDSLFGATDLLTCSDAQFLSPAYYTSLGFAVPASVAVQLARPDLRPIVLVGDGAFQMTGIELSTAARFGLCPIVIVLNNAGYSTERPMQEGAFNDVLRWDYYRLPDVFGSGQGFLVETEQQLVSAMVAARAYTASYSILDVRLAPDDISPALERLTSGLKDKV